MTVLFPHAVEPVQRLRRQGIRTTIASSRIYFSLRDLLTDMGIARQLVLATKEKAERMNLPLGLLVDKGNPPGAAFYVTSQVMMI